MARAGTTVSSILHILIMSFLLVTINTYPSNIIMDLSASIRAKETNIQKPCLHFVKIAMFRYSYGDL